MLRMLIVLLALLAAIVAVVSTAWQSPLARTLFGPNAAQSGPAAPEAARGGNPASAPGATGGAPAATPNPAGPAAPPNAAGPAAPAAPPSAAGPAAAASPNTAGPAAPAAPPATTGPGELSVVLDEAALTQQANAVLSGRAVGDTPLGAATVRNVAVQLRNGRLAATGSAQVGPTTVPLTVAATVEAVNGRPVVSVVEAAVAGVALPAGTRKLVEQTLQGQVDRALANQPLRVRTISIADGKMTVVGSRT
jgi:hypothetical protein